MSRAFILVFVAVLFACGGERGEASEHDAPSVRAEPGSVEGLRIHAEPASAGELVPVVEARGEQPVRVKRAIGVERKEGARWVSVAVRDLTLRPSCARPADTCITLVTGAGLRPPAWNGKSGDAQCECRTCTNVPEGTYRFVVESCEGSARATSEPFAVVR